MFSFLCLIERLQRFSPGLGREQKTNWSWITEDSRMKCLDTSNDDIEPLLPPKNNKQTEREVTRTQKRAVWTELLDGRCDFC